MNPQGKVKINYRREDEQQKIDAATLIIKEKRERDDVEYAQLAQIFK